MFKLLVQVATVLALAAALSPSDRARIGGSLNVPVESLKTAYQVTVSKSILKADLDQASCAYISSNTQLNLDDLYYASYVSKIQGCPLSLGGIEEFLNAEVAAEGAAIKTLFKAITALSNFGLPVSSADAVIAALKKEDSVRSHALAYLALAEIAGDVPKDVMDSVEDVAHRADSVGSAMSFDSGLMDTSMFLKGAFALSKKAGKALVSESMTKKFTNYILSNKNKNGLSDIFYMLNALDALSTNSVAMPTLLTVVDNSLVLSAEQPSFKLSLTNAIGEVLQGSHISVSASASPSTGKSLFEAGLMTADGPVYSVTAAAVNRGIYNIELSVDVGAGYLAPTSNSFTVKVVAPIEFSEAFLKVIDVDDNRILMSSDLENSPVEAKGDLSSRIILDFSLVDGAEKVVVHQAFLRFTNADTKQQVFFIAQADLLHKYTVDLNLRTASAKSFGSVSGTYNVDLIIGDATLASTKVWTIAFLTLEFPEKQAGDVYVQGAKPEIKHLFREPEKRPAEAISMVFTGLVLLPFLVLLGLWAKLGANISNMKLTISAIVFHGGLLAILGIYVKFYLDTDMFVTMQCLAVASIITFLGGHKLLASVAADKKAKC